MIPLRRCGSHAIRLRLNFNSAFYSPYPLHIVDFMPLLPLYGDLNDDNAYFQLIVDLVGLVNASMVKWDKAVFDPVVLYGRLRGEPRSVHRIVWEMLFEAGRAHHAAVVMDKSLDSVHYADENIELFDDFLFLNVVRDPRAQIASMNRAIIHEFDTLMNAGIWVHAHDAARRLMVQHPERILTVRFEDFVSDQEAVLRRICAFFGIDFLPEMLDVARSEEARQISGLSALWEANSSRPIPANVDKFKKSLSLEEIEVIETLTGEHMDFYGYERMTPGRATITTRQFQAAREHSDTGRREAWTALARNNYRDHVLRRFRADYLQMLKARFDTQARPVTEPRRQFSEPGRAAIAGRPALD
jgi:hypothetical protein